MKIMFTPQPKNVRIEQVYSLYKQSPFLFFGLLVVIYVISDYFWDSANPDILIGWLIANLILLVSRIILVQRFNKIKPQENAIKWGYAFMLASAISGLLWGFVPLFIMDTQAIEGVLLVSIIITGMVAASMVPLSYFVPTHLIFAIFSLLPFSYAMLIDPNPLIVKIGIIIFIYLITILAFSLNVSKSVTESIRLRFQNLELLDDLREEKLIADTANTDKSRFLAATSHDLRQPLHALDLYLGALKNKLSTEEQSELLDKATRSSHSLSELLNALMDISKLDAGNIEVKLSSFNLLSTFQVIVEEFQGMAKNKGLNIKILGAAVFVKSDALLLSRIVRNLVSNSIKYSDSGEITINIEEESANIKLSISDEGKGISQHELENIFSEFYQLDNPERDRNKGLGLGLAIVKRIANLLKHKINVSSELNFGSTFSILIPKSTHIQQDNALEKKPLNSNIEGLFIMCIDDEYEVRDALNALLKSWGCEVLIADSAQNILKTIKKDNYPAPDIIISDYRLRENKTGVEAIESVCQYFERKIPSILMTGDTGFKIGQEKNEIKSTIMFKPVIPTELLEQLVKLKV